MIFYQLVILVLFSIIPFFPVQIDQRIPYIMGISAILLIPLFVKNIQKDLLDRNPITIFFTLFLAASSLSTIFSIYPQRSIPQLVIFISSFIIFTSARSIFKSLKSKELLVTCLLSLATILSLISLYNTLFLHFVNFESKGVSFMWIYFGHNHLSALLIFAIPVSFYLLKKYWRKKNLNILFLVSCYLLLFSMLFTFGVGSIISLALSTLITFLLFIKVSFKKKILLSLVILSILVLSATGALLFAKSFRGDSQKLQYEKNTISSVKAHISYLQDAIDSGLKRPITGSGLDTFIIINSESQREARKTHYTHNFFFQILSDAGIFGFLTSVGLIGAVLWQLAKKIIRNSQRALLLALWVGLLASTLNTLVDFDWQLPYVFFLFWFLAAIALE